MSYCDNHHKNNVSRKTYLKFFKLMTFTCKNAQKCYITKTTLNFKKKL